MLNVGFALVLSGCNLIASDRGSKMPKAPRRVTAATAQRMVTAATAQRRVTSGTAPWRVATATAVSKGVVF